MVQLLAAQTNPRSGPSITGAVFIANVLSGFFLCFQITHDSWLVLLALDLFIAIACWGLPLRRPLTAGGWGLFGGLSALINPVLALVWTCFSLVVGVRQRLWITLSVALVTGALVVMPWSVRNYLVFGRWIPVKSNLANELYQSQCLQSDGLVQVTTFSKHPYVSAGPERTEYKEMGEMAFLDHKSAQFWQVVRDDPLDLCRRIFDRFAGATIWYVPYDRAGEALRPWALVLHRLIHPLPFLSLLMLVITARRNRLSRTQQIVIGTYVIYLLPYIAVSYYDRYALPLIGIKALLVGWGLERLAARVKPKCRRWTTC